MIHAVYENALKPAGRIIRAPFCFATTFRQENEDPKSDLEEGLTFLTRGLGIIGEAILMQETLQSLIKGDAGREALYLIPLITTNLIDLAMKSSNGNTISCSLVLKRVNYFEKSCYSNTF